MKATFNTCQTEPSMPTRLFALCMAAAKLPAQGYSLVAGI
jgi:hypothetical protein